MGNKQLSEEQNSRRRSSEDKAEYELSHADTIEKGSIEDNKLQKQTQAEPDYDAAGAKKIIRKIDRHLIPLLVFLYTLMFLDHVNIGNARLWNLEKDLHMKGYDYNIIVLVSATFAGFATSFGGLLTARIFIGIFEAGMFPGCLLLIGAWFRRHEVLTRMAWFMVSNDIAGTISGLLGVSLGSSDDIGGWSWISFVEGFHDMLRCRIGPLVPAAVPAPEHLLEAGVEGLAASKARGG